MMMKSLAVAALVAGIATDRSWLVLAGAGLVVGQALYRRDWSAVVVCVVSLPLLAGAWMGAGWCVVALVPVLAGWFVVDLRRTDSAS